MNNAFQARITFYTNDPKWGNKTASGQIAREGVSVAASKRFPFGTRFFIPKLKGVVGDGHFVVNNRGSAVDARKASGGKLPVVDVYVSSRARVRHLSSTKKFHNVIVHVKN